MEEMNNQDTPQPQTANTTGMDAFGAPVNQEGSDTNLSVEDAFFGKAEENNTVAPEAGQPTDIQENLHSQEHESLEAKNDAKRFEYWQSQAAKKDNELKTLQNQVQQVVQSQQAPMSTNEAPAQQEFPPPPPKPQKPQGFSREEAWGDPSSTSARYLDEVESWQDDIGEYRDLRGQYDLAVIRERFEAEDEVKKVNQQKAVQYNQTKQQLRDVYSHVTGHYGFTDSEAKDFIKSMSNAKSVSMENLVQLYRMQKGAGPVNTESQGPSQAFQQSRNAQQVPSPMGVMPGQATESQRSDADSIMDELITSHKSKNPWT